MKLSQGLILYEGNWIEVPAVQFCTDVKIKMEELIDQQNVTVVENNGVCDLKYSSFLLKFMGVDVLS